MTVYVTSLLPSRPHKAIQKLTVSWRTVMTLAQWLNCDSIFWGCVTNAKEHPPSGKLTVVQLCTICGFHSNFIEDLGLLKSDTVTVLEFQNVSKETDPQQLKMKALQCFRTPQYSDQTTHHHSPEALNPHYLGLSRNSWHFMEPKVHLYVHKSPPQVSTLSQIYPVHTNPCNFFQINFNISPECQSKPGEEQNILQHVLFYGKKLLAPHLNIQAGVPRLISHPWLFVQYIGRHPLYLKSRPHGITVIFQFM